MLEQTGRLKVFMYVVDSIPGNDDVFKDRTRRVTLLTRYSVTRSEAAEIAARFLKDNALGDERKHTIEALWTFSSMLFQE